MEKDKVNQIIDKAASDVIKNIYAILTENLQRFIDEFEKMETEQYIPYSMYFATMITALHMSIDIIRKSLCELLCDDEASNNATE